MKVNFGYEVYPAMEHRHDVLDGLVIVDLFIWGNLF